MSRPYGTYTEKEPTWHQHDLLKITKKVSHNHIIINSL